MMSPPKKTRVQTSPIFFDLTY